MSFSIRQLNPNDVAQMESLLTIFCEVFDGIDTYGGNRPDTTYLKQLLGSDSFIALTALKNSEVVGGIAAYKLKKFE